MAATLATLAGAVWLARRRRYRYTEPFTHADPPTPTPPTPPPPPPPPTDDETDDGDHAKYDHPGLSLPQDISDDDSVLYLADPRAQKHRPAITLNETSVPGGSPLDRTDDPSPATEPRGRTAESEPDPAVQPDSDLQPLPAPVNRLRDAVRAHNDTINAGHYPEAAATAPPTAGPTASPVMDTAIGSPLDIPAGGIGLDGPGAAAAARALLITAITSGNDTAPHTTDHVVITAPTLQMLFDGAVPDLHDLDRLHVVEHLEDALSALDQHILTRRRILDEHDPNDSPDQDSGRPPAQPASPILLLAPAPVGGSPLAARLMTTLHLAAPLQARGAFLGPWPPGHVLTVAADGHTTTRPQTPANASHPAGRISVLDTPAAIAFLHVITEAHTGQPPRPNPAPDVVGVPEESSARADLMRQLPTEIAMTSSLRTVAGTEDRAGAPHANGDVLTPHDAGRVRVRVLGKLAILNREERPVPGLRSGAAHLLVILAVHRNGQQLMDVMEKLWPDATTRRAAERLSTEAANLRRTVRQALGHVDDRTPATNAIINTGGFYKLNHDLLDIDLWRFGTAFTAAQTTDDPADQARHLHAAITEHTGHLAEGRDYPWADIARHQIHRDGIRTRLRLAALTTDTAERARITNQAADLDPANEDLARRAMRANVAAGNSDSVNRRLGTLLAALREINEEPTAETLELTAHLKKSIAPRNYLSEN